MAERQALNRRGILAAAGAVVAGIVTKQMSQPVRATSGTGGQGALILASNIGMNTANTATQVTMLLNTANGTPTVVYQLEDAFLAAAVDGTGVTGSSTNNIGVRGFGDTGVNGNGNSIGVFGYASSGPSKGVFGQHSGGGYGVYGQGVNGHGVYGIVSDNGYGVTGVATNSLGVFGQSTSGIGVLGQSTSASGVYGQSATGYGVLGYNTGGSASLSGISTNANIPAFAGGNSVAGGLAASFGGTVYVNGMFVVADMTQKHGLLKHPDGSHRLMYSVEAPESWAEDFGTGSLVAGKAEVTLDPDFAALVHTEDYHVFVTEHGGHHGLHTTAKGTTSFTVEADHELASAKGKSAAQVTGSFSWRVVAKPKSDKKVERLGKFTVPNIPLPDVSKLPKLLEPAKQS